MQEVFTLLAMAALAALIIAVGGVIVWHFQDAQRVADWAVAYVYPMARPLNTTHFWLGAQAAFADVEISRVLVNGTEYYVGAAAPRGRAVWLNASGRPLLARCNSAVVFDVRAGSASRTLAFRAVCPVENLKKSYWVALLLNAYASYVLDYVVFNSTALIAAYFKDDGVYIKNVWNKPIVVAVDPPIGRVYDRITDPVTGETPFPVAVLMPGQEFRAMPALGVFDATEVWRWVYSATRIYYSDSSKYGLEVWVNGVLAYNGTVKRDSVISVPSDVYRQINIFTDYYDLFQKRYYPAYHTLCDYVQGYWSTGTLGWRGWCKLEVSWDSRLNRIYPKAPILYRTTEGSSEFTIYVYPGAMLGGQAANFTVSATASGDRVTALASYAGTAGYVDSAQLVGPFKAYGLVAFKNGSSLALYWADPDTDAEYSRVITAPGEYYIGLPRGHVARVVWNGTYGEIYVDGQRAERLGLYYRYIYAYKITDVASYKYRLEVWGYNRRYLTTSGSLVIVARGRLWLYLWDRLVSYDEFHAIYREDGQSSSAPSHRGACADAKFVKPLIHDPTNMQTYNNGYSVTATGTYLVVTVGCGGISISQERKTIDVFTVDGRRFFTVDRGNGRYCTLSQGDVKDKGRFVGCKDQ